ncbi:uncharacterized protein LOC111410298 [Olea europaea var. sylvestris]|uniref:uncharacterized protein LOC111410298 n=1 Tax=Olea europaea var. sylvestris TaxID=158386 RepID=UPI000C1D3006|nr:uncharacterized protein LOC111410298 [Olea europaea var. sylvestris]
MEHPFFPTTTTSAEVLRLLTIAEELLWKRDLMRSKSFATRARDSDPTLLPADQILAVTDTLLSGDRRIGNDLQDWYSILQVSPHQGRDMEVVASQYRRLALLLNPLKNKFAFADQAFRLVLEAWTVLSNPLKKSLYDKELAFYMQPHLQPQTDLFNPLLMPQEHLSSPTLQQNLIFFGGNRDGSVGHPSHAQPQPHVHGGSSSSSATHFPQVQVHPQLVDPVAIGAIREHASKHQPQNFINFTSCNNMVFGSGSGSAQETLNKQPLQYYTGFTGNVHSVSGSNLNVHANENVQEQRVDEPEVERMDTEEVEEEDEEEEEEVEEERVDIPSNDGGSTFWTACPYCYHMYEYPGVYAECTLRCQNCRRAFQGVVIPSPPPIVNGREGYFYSWGFFPLGVSMESMVKNRDLASTWTPFSPMFTCPQMGNGNHVDKKGEQKASAPRVYVQDDEVYVELSDSSESNADWHGERPKKKNKMTNVQGKSANEMPKKAIIVNTKKVRVKAKNANAEDEIVLPQGSEMLNKSVGKSSKKGGAAGNAQKTHFEKLDLNVEFSNEVEEPAPSMNQEIGPVRGEDDNIEGIGFFEGLDEFLSSLPILNAVGDDKVVKAA